MSHVKAGGTAKNTKDSPGQRLGIKRSGGQTVTTGQIIFRQIGMTKLPGKGTTMSRNYTIHAAKDGVVTFITRSKKTYTGKTVRRTEIQVI
ncbi:50S ribosomal protein L27 [bacterium]|nr:50S ribosomal protein L27 [bacterium]NBX97875.1 50S ribosomal protein L27 [bacterium]NDC93885.1 50S ribosomal protein L27 [bacterium]NDD82832.1 50S ribosomal protein L27 [bacterium]NDG28720.1 50S ribosomal protein L27 [bacterium]